MSEPETLPAEVHPEAALLPWYANDTLGSEERQSVARHLESCAGCRRELEELTQLKHDLAMVYGAAPSPSPQLARSVLQKVAVETSLRRSADLQGGHRLAAVDQWLRSLFLPQWVPTLAAIMLVVQFGLLLWVTMPVEEDRITTRSIESLALRYRVSFQEQATEGEIRALLNAIRGRIVDGPTAERTYVIEVRGGDPDSSKKTLAMLRARTEIVALVETLTP
ncbi:MAG: hypothetical protein GDA67_04685 [Nitrospira sp. CR1.3]|nr:hypothetical protein [Nitrospira sp. CR1.3]